jgi:hypothetical protein
MLFDKRALYQKGRRCSTTKGLQANSGPDTKKLPFTGNRVLQIMSLHRIRPQSYGEGDLVVKAHPWPERINFQVDRKGSTWKLVSFSQVDGY